MNLSAREQPRKKWAYIKNEYPLWFLIATGVLFFYRPLIGGETFFFRDLFSIFLTQKQLWLDCVNAGEFPLWDPFLHGGRPYFANALNSTFYPSNLLFLILPFFRAFNVMIVGHFLYTLAGAYLLARQLKLQPISSLIVGIVYGFCGYMLSVINLLNMFLAMTHLPLLLACWHLFFLSQRRRWFILTVLIGAVQIFAGSPEISLLSLFLLFAWGIGYPTDSLSFPRKIVLCLLAGLLIAGVAAIQIIPQIEMFAYSSRRYGLSYAALSTWSLPPTRLPELVWPEFFGRPDTILEWTQNYWGSRVAPEPVPLIFSIYLGGAALWLTLCGGFHHRPHPLTRRVRLILFGIFGGSFVLSFGRFLPLFRIIAEYVPLMSFFRYPSKFFSIGLLPCALLAGYTVDVHFGPLGQQANQFRHTPSARLLIILRGMTLVFTMFTLLFLFSKDFAWQVQTRIFNHTDDAMYAGLRASLLHAFGGWLMLVILYHYRRMRYAWWHGWLLAGIILVDLLSAGQHLNQFAPETLFATPPNTVQLVRQEMGDGRIFRPIAPSAPKEFQPLSAEMMVIYRWTLETLDNSFAAFFRLPVIFHTDFDRLAPAASIQLKTLIDSLSWESRLPLLSAAGVSLILTPEKLALPMLPMINIFPNWTGSPLYVYRNAVAAHRVTFAPVWQTAETDADALGYLLNPAYDPRHIVILQPPESTLALLRAPKPSHSEDNVIITINTDLSHLSTPFRSPADACQAAAITIQNRTTTSSQLLVATPCDGYLVFAESFYPGWHVTTNGRSTPILRANYAFSAVFLPAGEHTVRRWYRPMSLLLGAICSGGSLSGLVMFGIAGWLGKIHQRRVHRP